MKHNPDYAQCPCQRCIEMQAIGLIDVIRHYQFVTHRYTSNVRPLVTLQAFKMKHGGILVSTIALGSSSPWLS